MNLRRTVFLALLILAIAGGAWGAYYAREHGFTQSWRKLIEGEIAKQGYYVDIGRLTLGPFQGLVAQDVRFYQEPKRKTVIAFIDNVILDIDLSQVIDKKVSINSIDFKDADLSLPIDPKDKNSERLQIRRCSARILMPTDKIEIVKAEARIHGIQVSLKGTLLKPLEESQESSTDDKKAGKKITEKERHPPTPLISERRHLIHRILKELDSFDFPSDQPPRIEVHVRGSLDRINELSLTARLSANHLSRSGYSTKKVDAMVESSASGIKLRQFHLQDAKGNLRLRGEWAPTNSYADFELDSSIDLQSLAQSIHPSPSIGEVVFFSSPQIAIEGRWHFDKTLEFDPASKLPQLPADLIGSFSCEKFGSRGEVFDGLESDFSLSDGKYYLRNLRLEHKSGSALANVFYDLPGQDFRFEAEVKFDVGAVTPFLAKENARKFLRRWQFDNESNVYLGITGTGTSLQPSTWKMSGPIDLRNCRFNGIFFDHVSLDFESENRTHYYRNLKMSRSDGSISASVVSNDLENKQIHVENGIWTLPPVIGMRTFNPNLAEKLSPYRFRQAPSIELSGSIDARNSSQIGSDERQHDLDVHFSSDHPLDYQFLGKDLQLDQTSGHLQIKGETIHLTDFTAKTLNGSLVADYRVNDPGGEKKYAASVELSHIDFRELTRLYSDYESTTGDLNAEILIGGSHGDLDSVTGKATATLHDGDIFAIPMLGPLSKILGEAMPKAKPSYSVAKEASATFTMQNGVVRTENFEALTPAFKFNSAGEIQLADQKVDLEASFDVRGTAGILLLPVSKVVSKILEYKAEGTVGQPDWKPKYIPRIMPTVKAIIPGGRDRMETVKPHPPEDDKPRKKLFNFKRKLPTDTDE